MDYLRAFRQTRIFLACRRGLTARILSTYSAAPNSSHRESVSIAACISLGRKNEKEINIATYHNRKLQRFSNTDGLDVAAALIRSTFVSMTESLLPMVTNPCACSCQLYVLYPPVRVDGSHQFLLPCPSSSFPRLIWKKITRTD